MRIVFSLALVALLVAGPAMAAAPSASPMQAQMVTGKGSAEFERQGSEVLIRLKAEQLPPPDSYELWLTNKVTPLPTGPHLMLASLRIFDGRLQLTYAVPRSVLAKWRYVQLIHLPSGRMMAESQAHPALSAPIPGWVSRP